MSSDSLFVLLNFALAVLNFGVASVLVIRGWSISRDIAGASTTAADQYAYQALLDTRASVSSSEEAERYYDRFWAGQVLQYEHWRARLIPDLIYEDWLLTRRRQHQENANLAGISFRAAWAARHDGRYAQNRFGRFMSRVLTDGARPDETTDEAIRCIRRAMKWARGG